VPLVVLISISLALQISVGVLLIFLGRSLLSAHTAPAQAPTTLHTQSCRALTPPQLCCGPECRFPPPCPHSCSWKAQNRVRVLGVWTCGRVVVPASRVFLVPCTR
jgi:hypothetical protein